MILGRWCLIRPPMTQDHGWRPLAARAACRKRILVGGSGGTPSCLSAEHTRRRAAAIWAARRPLRAAARARRWLRASNGSSDSARSASAKDPAASSATKRTGRNQGACGRPRREVRGTKGDAIPVRAQPVAQHVAERQKPAQVPFGEPVLDGPSGQVGAVGLARRRLSATGCRYRRLGGAGQHGVAWVVVAGGVPAGKRGEQGFFAARGRHHRRQRRRPGARGPERRSGDHRLRSAGSVPPHLARLVQPRGSRSGRPRAGAELGRGGIARGLPPRDARPPRAPPGPSRELPAELLPLQHARRRRPRRGRGSRRRRERPE
jgi:hypothetical protein